MLYPFTSSISRTRRVVITGAGIVTAHGIGWETNSESFRVGKQSFRPVTLFDVTRQRSKNAAEVDLPDHIPGGNLTLRQQKRLGRSVKMLILAAQEAVTQAGWKSNQNIPAVIATTSGGMSFGEDFLKQLISNPRDQTGQSSRVVLYQPQMDCLLAMKALGFSGSINIISNACASGANAIGHAYQSIRNGTSDCVLTGGYDALSQLTFAGFDSLQALSKTHCKPFEAGRDGLSLGEGAGILALEELGHALARGARILGEIVGYGAATDIHHLTQPNPDGSAALESMRMACKAADVSPEQVDYINAHGTATIQNDSAEANAINCWAGEAVVDVRVSSTKSGIGHLLGAAGAVEAVVCLMTLDGQWLPPQKNHSTTDPLCKFKIVRQETCASVDYVLSNSFGFGGSNATLLFRKFA